ncbi:MAG: peptidylprolyl isomerase [Ignavibacteriae bacterium]|nr:peptidylprolyl isomerase [Ignavibacteriota bacterium]MCB9242612.1 peptidylprolyl isomerase [Ignavibacteriales bacterium]
MSKKAILLFVLMILFAGTGYSQPKQGDRILAVVGNDVILESDFQYQVQVYARQNQLQEVTPSIAQQIFQQMLTDKIIYAKAVQDSVEISEEDINRELDYRIQSLIEQVGSPKQLEEIYGMSLGRIKLLLKDDLEKKLRADRLKREKFRGGIKISDKEVREFYETYRDSLPAASSEYELSQIYVTRKISDTEKDLAKQKALQILDSIKAGANFEDLAKRNSDDKASAVNGGYLGPAGKGVFVKPFEEALFSMTEGEVSEPIESQFGYHIIKLENINGDKRTARHILVEFPKLESSDLETISFLNGIKSKVENGEMTFKEAAYEFSQGSQAQTDSGYAGLIPLTSLDSAELEALTKVSPGGITEAIRVGSDGNYGYEILMLHRFSPEHELNLTDDYDRIKQFALYFKENKEMEDWINEIRETIYVDIRF